CRSRCDICGTVRLDASRSARITRRRQSAGNGACAAASDVAARIYEAPARARRRGTDRTHERRTRRALHAFARTDARSRFVAVTLSKILERAARRAWPLSLSTGGVEIMADRTVNGRPPLALASSS